MASAAAAGITPSSASTVLAADFHLEPAAVLVFFGPDARPSPGAYSVRSTLAPLKTAAQFAPSLRDSGVTCADRLPTLKRGANEPCAYGAVPGIPYAVLSRCWLRATSYCLNSDNKSDLRSRSVQRRSTLNCTRVRRLSARNSQALAQFFHQQAAAGRVGLEPLAVDHQLRHRALARMLNHFGRGSGIRVHVNLSELDAMLRSRNSLADRQSRHQFVAYNSTVIGKFYRQLTAMLCDEGHSGECCLQ